MEIFEPNRCACQQRDGVILTDFPPARMRPFRGNAIAGWLLLMLPLMLLGGWATPVASAEGIPNGWPHFFAGQVDNLGDSNPLPDRWSPRDVTWSAALEGYGQSSPIVWRDTVFATSVSGAEKEDLRVTAVSLSDGSVKWVRVFRSTAPETSGQLISRAAPTPACDEDGLFVFFESGDLFALDHHGETRWHVSLADRFGRFENKFGLAASPILTQQAVIVLVDHDGPSYLAAFSRTDGSLLWKRDRPREGVDQQDGQRREPPNGRSWSSPALVHAAGRDHLVCSSAGSLVGYDPRSGETLWAHEEIGGNTVATPIDLGGGRFLVASLIRPADGPTAYATESNLLARIVEQEAGFRLQVEWVAEKARGSFCSPVASQDLAYWVNPTGVVFGIDLATGEQRFSNRLPCGACWATPLVVGDRVYFFGKDGEATILKSSPEFELISTGHRTRDPDDRPDAPVGEAAVADDDTADEASGGEASAARRRVAALNSGVTLYAAIRVGTHWIVRYGDRIDCLNFAVTPNR